MDELARTTRLHHFVEEMGLLMEETGGSRMMGRVMGHLLICDPAEQSASDLADALQASAGSISQTTRQLVAAGLVDRVSLPGDRKTYFRFRDGAYVDQMRSRSSMLTMFREVADRGLALLDDKPATQRARLRDFRDFYAFMEGQIPGMVARWHEHRAAMAAKEEG